MSYVEQPFNIAWGIQRPPDSNRPHFIVLSFWYTESPRWLLEKHPDNTDRVLEVLCKLRMGDQNSEMCKMRFHETCWLLSKPALALTTGYKGLFKSKACVNVCCMVLYATDCQQSSVHCCTDHVRNVIYKSLGWGMLDSLIRFATN